MGYVTESAGQPGHSAMAAAVVTSKQGVLVGRRREGNRRWTLPLGIIGPAESPEEVAVREVMEGTGLSVRVTGIIGSRLHPQTGRLIIYVAASPADESECGVGDTAGLADVRWIGETEAGELIGDMAETARQYLRTTLGG